MPGVTRQNIGLYTPADLLMAARFFDSKYEEE